MLRRITIFLAVARHLSYTKAAEELYMSQPAVSKNIKELEKEWQIRLFDRHGNHIALTPAGKIAYDRGSALKRQVQNLRHELGALSNSLSGTLYIGASSTIAQYIIPPVLAAFKATNPKINLSLVSGNTSEIYARLGENHLDLAIIEGRRRINDFDYQPFMKDEIALISSPKSGLKLPPEISRNDLLSVPLAIRETGSGTREVFSHALQKMGLTPADLTIDLSLGSTESIKSYVPHAKTAGVFSTSALQKGQNTTFTVSRIANHPIKRTFMFAAKQGDEHKLAQEFMQFSRRHYNLTE